jgi:hypothetical protein
MYPQRQLIEDPLVLRRKDLGENKFTYRVTLAKGAYFRVAPSTWKEVLFIRLLEKGHTLEVPADGDGLLIKDSAIPQPPPR